jgi:hypothetical protein
MAAQGRSHCNACGVSVLRTTGSLLFSSLLYHEDAKLTKKYETCLVFVYLRVLDDFVMSPPGTGWTDRFRG